MKPLLNKRLALKLTLLLSLIVLGLTPVSLMLAQSGGGYAITHWTLGGSVTGGSGYNLTGGVNQAEPGAVLTGNGYTLVGGYWTETTSSQQYLYLPVILGQ